jgi:colanic acid/amylovoran biosynthesis glycosyltransferase
MATGSLAWAERAAYLAGSTDTDQRSSPALPARECGRDGASRVNVGSSRGVPPRTLFVGRTRYEIPLGTTHLRKFAALAEELDFRVLASAAGRGLSDRRWRLVPAVRPRLLDGPLFYALLPFRLMRELRAFQPHIVIAESPYTGAAALVARRLAGVAVEVVVEIHADWRTSTRLYGRRARAVVAPLGDAIAASAVRRADAVRTVSEFTASLVRELGVEPTAIFHAFIDTEAFLERPPEPLPTAPRVAFIGVLERYKSIAVLARAWRLAAPRLPGATLELVGRGSLSAVVEALVTDVPEQTVWHEHLDAGELAALLDRSTCLVLPSASEGLPRVAIEALARGRPVIGSRAGGIPETVVDGINGLLVPVGDVEALAEALVRVLSDEVLASRLAREARPAVEPLLMTPKEYAERMRALVDTVVGVSARLKTA